MHFSSTLGFGYPPDFKPLLGGVFYAGYLERTIIFIMLIMFSYKYIHSCLQLCKLDLNLLHPETPGAKLPGLN